MTFELTDDEVGLIAEAKEVTKEIDALLPRFVAAQKNWFRSRNETDAQTLNVIQAQADRTARPAHLPPR